MRHVFPTTEIPHKWAHQTQDNARNPQGNLFFEGPTIYSYRHSWPLASIHTKRGAPPLVLTNSDRYGSTTARHQHNVNRAVNHLASCAVPDPLARTKEQHAHNIAQLWKEIKAYQDKASRVLSVSAVEWRENAANERYADVLLYCRFFGIRKKQGPAPDFSAALDRARRIETPDPIRDAAKFRAKQRREEKRKRQDADALAAWTKDQEERIIQWRAGENVYVNYFPGHYRRHGYPNRPTLPCMLRVKGEEIQTSQGATIPLDHAPRIWRLIEKVRARGEAYVRNGHTEHAGTFPIDRVDADGTLHAGCHVIAYDEMLRLAYTLNLALPDATPETRT